MTRFECLLNKCVIFAVRCVYSFAQGSKRLSCEISYQQLTLKPQHNVRKQATHDRLTHVARWPCNPELEPCWNCPAVTARERKQLLLLKTKVQKTKRKKGRGAVEL